MKNTIRFAITNLLCPLFCLNCCKCGDILCDCCKKNIRFGYGKCLKCGNNLTNGECLKCSLPFRFQFCLGDRRGVLKELIADFKYRSNKAAGLKLAQLVAETTGLDSMAVLVPLPTIARHKRERGFGQTEWLAKRLSELFDCRVIKLLSRAKNTVQVGASSDLRKIQAKEAYDVLVDFDPDRHYVLLDDVWTTGSSMMAAAELLRKKGAKNISALLLARTV